MTDVQWYEQHFRKTSKMLTSLLRHDNSPQLRSIRRNRIQGDVALIDFLLTDAMQRNLPRLCPASLWALAHCTEKQRFTFGIAVGTSNLRGDPDFLMRFNRYLTEKKQVDPAEFRKTSSSHVVEMPLRCRSRKLARSSRPHFCSVRVLFPDQRLLRLRPLQRLSSLLWLMMMRTPERLKLPPDLQMSVRKLLLLCSTRRPMLKSPPTTRPKAVLKSPPVTLTRAPPPVERYVVPKGPAVVPIFDISDFPMTLPGLPSSIASSPATTLAPETPRVPLPRASSQPKAMEPPPAISPKPRPPSREQVQTEVDAIMREYDEKRAKRTEEQQRLHDTMLSAIFKSVFEDTVPDSAAGIYSSGEKDRMGCDIPKVIDFRSLTLGH